MLLFAPATAPAPCYRPVAQMLPKLEGVIARRVLLNFWVDPEVAQELVPSPLEPAIQEGYAVAGICLIRLAQLRPKGIPAGLGTSSENMAHRIAIRYPAEDGLRDGVFVWRRETDRALVKLLGGRLFPGVHGRARFHVFEDPDRLSYRVRSEDHEADVDLDVRVADEWQPTKLFPTFDEVTRFFERGDCGFSCSLRGNRLEGLRLRSLQWQMAPLSVEKVESAFYGDPLRFPPGTKALDGAVLMRGVPHEWHGLNEIPELANVSG